MSGKLQLLLLCGSCLCLRGAPIQLPKISPSGTTHGASTSSTAGRLTSVGETPDQLTETENWDTSGTLKPEKHVQDPQSPEKEETRIDGLPGEPEPKGTPVEPAKRSTASQLERRKRKPNGEQETQETSPPSSTDDFSPSLLPDTPQMFTPLTGCDGGSTSSPSDPLSDEGLMCRQDRRRAGTATPAAAASENDRPDEPFKVQGPAAPQRTHRMGFHQPADAMTTSELLLTTDGDGASWSGSTLLPDQIPPRQKSGDDPKPVSSSGPRLLQAETKLEHQLEPEEQDEDENSEESEEEDSEEDLAERSTESPYGPVPPPPLWVQGNQGLMRSWLELIKEKVGHVSGMLVPVGIGITGALTIVGLLYSIRMVYRRRRDDFKELRRKVRQPEHLHEHASSVQDQAMLLVNSSEDEF